MNIPIGVDMESGLIHLVETIAAKVNTLAPGHTFLMGMSILIYAQTVSQGNEKRKEMVGKTFDFWITMRPGKRRALLDNQDGRVLDFVETV